jgi:deoxyribonuclease-4
VEFVNGSLLLIETSAGETGELLSDIDEFIEFYHSLPISVKEKVGVCVDTCHVFSAGYSPMEFIFNLEKNGVPIRLVHFNDCKKQKGCRKDLHESPGRGYIGLPELISVGCYCREKGIDMICE